MADTSYTFHPSDYLRDTVGLSLLEHGAYRLLLDHYYSSNGILPADNPRLYRICGAFDDIERGAVDAVVDKFFVNKNGNLTNKRADAELERKRQFLEMQSLKGRRGGRPKKNPEVSSVKNEDIVFVFKYYINAFKNRFKEEPILSKDLKDRMLLIRLLKTYDKERITKVIDKFFDSDDEFIMKSGYTIGVFYSVFNKLIIGKQNKPIARKECWCGKLAKAQSDNEWLCLKHFHEKLGIT